MKKTPDRNTTRVKQSGRSKACGIMRISGDAGSQLSASGAGDISLMDFASSVMPALKRTSFHEVYYRILGHFAKGDICKLIVSVPPQHGKSLGASVMLPAYMLGLNPRLKVAIASYNAVLASRFNKRVQRIIDSKTYGTIFPRTAIKPLSGRSDYVRTASHAEIIEHGGEIFSVGREGSLTGNEVDVLILDDLYKNATEANSPVIRESCWDWYTSVVRTRMHNDSRELMVFTRWHEEDLIGTVLSKEKNTLLSQWSQIETAETGGWFVVNFEALKDSPPNELDPRAQWEALWPERHNKELLEGKRALDPFRFNCMYQGRPSPRSGLLYGNRIKLYEKMECEAIRKGNYTDTADLGDDYLCSVCYDVGMDGIVYVTDVVYSREGMEVTEKLVAGVLERNMTRYAHIESNNGGRGFARAVGRMVPHVRIEWFHQSGNKEARILSNSATVIQNIRMPAGWGTRWPEFYDHIVNYRRLFRANRWHDAPDVITGIVEREILDNVAKKISRLNYSGKG